jgi:Platelet-activating factor acetylhydrolase, isoform II
MPYRNPALGILLLGILFLSAAAHAADNRGQNSDPGEVGPYAIGHTSEVFVNPNANNRPVSVNIFYPVDPRSVDSPTPEAQYPLDIFENQLPVTTSTQWEQYGYEHAYEAPKPSHDGPFPLVIFSPGWSGSYWAYIYIGTRLASHGYVVAILEHYSDWNWAWIPGTGEDVTIYNRPRDVSAAITELLRRNRTQGDLLLGTMDPRRIAMSGHSLGGYTAFALTGGDNNVCDELWGVLFQGDSLPYPASTCVPTLPDRPIKAIVTLDGWSPLLHFGELSRVEVPSLVLGETVDALTTWEGYFDWTGLPDMNARSHAAIHREDSYRVDIDGINHSSLAASMCDGTRIMFQLGVLSAMTGGDGSQADLDSFLNSFWCSTTLPRKDAREVITKYMIAFLDLYLGRRDADRGLDRWILTPGYAATHQPTVQFFDSEKCRAALPDDTHFTYRPYQLSNECDVAQKDPTGWFASSTPNNAEQMPAAPATKMQLRLKKPF